MALEFALNHADPLHFDTDCLVIGLYADKTLTTTGQAVDRASGGHLSRLAERGDLSGKSGSSASGRSKRSRSRAQVMCFEIEQIGIRRAEVIGSRAAASA